MVERGTKRDFAHLRIHSQISSCAAEIIGPSGGRSKLALRPEGARAVGGSKPPRGRRKQKKSGKANRRLRRHRTALSSTRSGRIAVHRCPRPGYAAVVVPRSGRVIYSGRAFGGSSLRRERTCAQWGQCVIAQHPNDLGHVGAVFYARGRGSTERIGRAATHASIRRARRSSEKIKKSTRPSQEIIAAA